MSENCETCKGRDYNVCRCGTHFITVVRDHGGLCHDCREAESREATAWGDCPNCNYGIRPGDFIHEADGGWWVHDNCDDNEREWMSR